VTISIDEETGALSVEVGKLRPIDLGNGTAIEIVFSEPRPAVPMTKIH
jgi:hypothetical protein